MYIIGVCYNCGHYVAFEPDQKTVLCRRCEKRLNCAKVKRVAEVNTPSQASEVIKALESKDKVIGFGTMER